MAILSQSQIRFFQMKPKIIFFGNGPLADHSLEILSKSGDIIFHARTKEDLEKVKFIKNKHPDAHGILASFGILIKPDILNLFEPEGILNIHPSLLPDLRGPSPIESAILRGDTSFSVSIMKLAKNMDAGPIFYQYTFTPDDPTRPDLKSYLYTKLASLGASWIVQHIDNLPAPQPQVGTPTFCGKFDKSMSLLDPSSHTAAEILHQILAFQGFPKPKLPLKGKNCIILEAHIPKQGDTALLSIPCADGQNISIDRLQPENKRPMDARSFLNGLH